MVGKQEVLCDVICHYQPCIANISASYIIFVYFLIFFIVSTFYSCQLEFAGEFKYLKFAPWAHFIVVDVLI